MSLSLAGTPISRFVAAGCLQGGVLSPFLWNLVLDDLLSNFEIADSFLQAFADDLAMVLSTSALLKAVVREWTELKQQERLGSSSISKSV